MYYGLTNVVAIVIVSENKEFQSINQNSPLSLRDLLLGVSVRWVSVTDNPQPRYGGRAGGTHPTEMHSCLWMVL